jgi:hypothetical protein
MSEKFERSERRINLPQVVGYLNHAFAKAMSKASSALGNKAVRIVHDDGRIETTTLYEYQVDFCYLIDEIQRGPTYIIPKVIQDANDLIARLEREGEKGA